MQEIKAGTLLIAEPFLLDPNFTRSVILICEHNEVGTTGFMISKQLDKRIHHLVPGFPESKAAVYIGGPVAPDSLHYLHNVGDMLDNSIEICPGIYWGGDFETLKFLMNTGVIKDENIKFFVGYSGWSEGQLAEELQEPAWLQSEMDANYLFKTRTYVLWQTVMKDKGDRYTVIAQMPDEALN
jgi:putative transcriptional regulator